MLKELIDAVSVEDVAARKLGAGLRAEFSCVTDRTELIFVDAIEVTDFVCAVNVQAGKALFLIFDTLASVAALMDLVTEGNNRVKNFWLASADHDLFLFLLHNEEVEFGYVDDNLLRLVGRLTDESGGSAEEESVVISDVEGSSPLDFNLHHYDVFKCV